MHPSRISDGNENIMICFLDCRKYYCFIFIQNLFLLVDILVQLHLKEHVPVACDVVVVSSVYQSACCRSETRVARAGHTTAVGCLSDDINYYDNYDFTKNFRIK